MRAYFLVCVSSADHRAGCAVTVQCGCAEAVEGAGMRKEHAVLSLAATLLYMLFFSPAAQPGPAP